MSIRVILDPHNLANGRLDKLDEQLRLAKTYMARSPEKGGMPFIYAFTATKEHHLEEIIMPCPDGQQRKIKTAATDGKKYKWDPDFLEKLTIRELTIVLAHETYHIIMQHCNPSRVLGKHRAIWNIAVDYVVNAAIEHDLRINLNNRGDNLRIDSYQCDKAYQDGSEHPIWNGVFNKPYPLKKFLKTLKKSLKKRKLAKDLENNEEAEIENEDEELEEETEIENEDEELEEETEIENEDEEKINENDYKLTCVFADYSLYGRSAESIYEEIMDLLREHGIGDINDILKSLGIESLDEHENIDISRSELMQEVLDAATSAKKMNAGNLPAGVESILQELQTPKLSWQDIVRQAIQKKRQEKGIYNDWSRFRRRALSLGYYSPRKKDDSITWLCMLDTSGSMSQDDISYGISQLQVLDGRSRGIVVPCDAEPYWNKAVEINTLTDLPRVNIVGRGGTVFDSFFKDFKKYIQENIDLIIVISDGFFTLDNSLNPHIDTVFVITNSNMPNIPFGRVAPLRGHY